MVLAELAKASKEKRESKKPDSEIYSYGFHSISGFISGFLMVLLWDKLNIPYLGYKIKKSLITHTPIPNARNVTVDRTIALSVSSMFMISEAFGIKGGIATGTGFLLGYTFATQFRKNRYVGNI